MLGVIFIKRRKRTMFNEGIGLIILGVVILIITQVLKATNDYIKGKESIEYGLVTYAELRWVAYVVDTVFILSLIIVAVGIGLMIAGAIKKSKDE